MLLPTALWEIGLLKDSNALLGQPNIPSSPALSWKARKGGPGLAENETLPTLSSPVLPRFPNIECCHIRGYNAPQSS